CRSRRKEAQNFTAFGSDQSLLTSAPTILKYALTRLLLAAVLLAETGSVEAGLIFNTNANWRLFKGRTEASTPDTTAWRRLNFVDSSFVDARAPFWYNVTGDSSTLSGGTRLSDMQNQYTCIFLRRTFV